jgi:glycine cleavage system H protein
MIPNDLLYTKTHEWVRFENGEAIVGITHFAQDQLGDLTYVELPDAGDTFSAGDEMGTVESVKAASEVYMPLEGEIVAVNEDLEDSPELVNQEPYDDGWLVRIKYKGEPENLLSPEEYGEMIETEGH